VHCNNTVDMLKISLLFQDLEFTHSHAFAAMDQNKNQAPGAGGIIKNPAPVVAGLVIKNPVAEAELSAKAGLIKTHRRNQSTISCKSFAGGFPPC
jgi:hypothetical protein